MRDSEKLRHMTILRICRNLTKLCRGTRQFSGVLATEEVRLRMTIVRVNYHL